MNLFHKFGAALTAAALAAALLLSGIFLGFHGRTLKAAQDQRLDSVANAVSAMLREAELASDPLMAVDYLSGLCSSDTQLAACDLDIGRGVRRVKTRGRQEGPPGDVRTRKAAGTSFSARLHFSEKLLEEERRAALAGVWRDLGTAFGASALAAALLGLGLAWRMTSRLKRLASHAAAVGEGRFGETTPVEGSDEVAGLSRAFNAMSERLLELETMKKNFTASVTHELRSPLGVIETYAGMLIKEKDRFSPDDVSVFARIRENAVRLSNFVTAMLDLARIERGRMELNRVRTDPLALAADAADFLRPKAAEKGITLAVRATGGPAEGLLDRELMTHALTNLLANALKFAPDKGRVTLRAAAAGGRFRAEVEDNGPGLSPGEEMKLFTPYTQGSAARGKGGTGLGLALSRAIVELHGGSIGCGRAPGGGAIFWFEVPL